MRTKRDDQRFDPSHPTAQPGGAVFVDGSRHTPGPWRYKADEFGDFTIQPASHELAIAAVVNGAFRAVVGETTEHEANARLLAAAPDLLTALREAKAFHDRDSGCNGFTADYECLRLQIDEALAKATLAKPTPSPEEGR